MLIYTYLTNFPRDNVPLYLLIFEAILSSILHGRHIGQEAAEGRQVTS
jgi:hypothetical protein